MDQPLKLNLTPEVDVDLFLRPRVERNQITPDQAQVDSLVGSILADRSCNTW